MRSRYGNRQHTSATRHIVVIWAALALLMAACGDGQGSNTTEAANTTQATETTSPGSGGICEEAADGGTATIGVAAPISGEAAIFGIPVDQTVRAVVNETNRLGGVWGTTLEVVTEDELFNPTDGVRVVNKLANTDNAQAIIGVTSGTLMATLDFAQQNEVMIISPYAGIVEYEGVGGNYSFRTVGPDSLDGMSIATFLREEGYDSLALLHENSDSAESTSRWLAQFFEEQGGEVLDTVSFSPGQGSYLAEVRAAFGNDPDVVFLAATGENAVPILREAAREDGDAQWAFIIELSNDEFVETVGPDVVGSPYGQTTVGATGSEAYATMVDLLDEHYPGEGESIAQAPAAAQDYDAAVVTVLAMYAGCEATAQAVNEHYREVANPPGVEVTNLEDGFRELAAGNDIDYVGASGPVDFNEWGTAAPDYAILQFLDGTFDIVRQYEAVELFELMD